MGEIAIRKLAVYHTTKWRELMRHIIPYTQPIIRETPLWISDWEVRRIFSITRICYQNSNGYVVREADGIYIRDQRTREGTLGLVYRNPFNGQNWLWAISKKTRQPFALAKVG